MDMEKRPPASTPRGDEPTTQQQHGVDLDALTAAVERLLRRDLEIEHERLHGARRG